MIQPNSAGLILVVDDEPDILELIRYNLEREGYTTFGCETGEEAIEQLFRAESKRLQALLPVWGGDCRWHNLPFDNTFC